VSVISYLLQVFYTDGLSAYILGGGSACELNHRVVNTRRALLVCELDDCPEVSKMVVSIALWKLSGVGIRCSKILRLYSISAGPPLSTRACLLTAAVQLSSLV